jgi:hypothetical protein
MGALNWRMVRLMWLDCGISKNVSEKIYVRKESDNEMRHERKVEKSIM